MQSGSSQTGYGANGHLIATDLDYLVSLGYADADAKKALQLTNGDRSAACYLLAKGSLHDNSSAAWRQEMTDDWIDGVAKHSLPKDAEGRALQKSPVYIRLASYQNYDTEDTKYEVKVTLKDGRQWAVWRSYSDFANFWKSLPFGTCLKFKNGFPVLAVFQFFSNDKSPEFVDNRMQKLNEWMRELVFDEVAMSSSKVLAQLYTFIDAVKFGGVVGIDSAMSLQTANLRHSIADAGNNSSNNNNNSNERTSISTSAMKGPPPHGTAGSRSIASPLSAQYSFRNYDTARTLHGSRLPLLDKRLLPLPLNQIVHHLPCRVDLKLLPTYQEAVKMKKPSSPSLSPDVKRGSNSGASKAAAFPNDERAKIESAQISADDLIANMEMDLSFSNTELHDSNHNALLQAAADDDDAVAAEVNRSVAAATAASGSKSVSIKSGIPIDCPVSIDMRQLRKDYERDRVVIQGRKLAGSHCSIENMLQISVDVIKQMLAESRRDLLAALPLSANSTSITSSNGKTNASAAVDPIVAAGSIRKFLQLLSQCVLQAISRTESAYFSHACLHDILDVTNSKNAADFSPFLFVPEAVLADAVEVRFRIIDKPVPPTATATSTAATAETTRSTTGSSSGLFRTVEVNSDAAVVASSPLLEAAALSSIQKRRASGSTADSSITKQRTLDAAAATGTIALPPGSSTLNTAPRRYSGGSTLATSNNNNHYSSSNGAVVKGKVGMSPLLADGSSVVSSIASRRAQLAPATATVAAATSRSTSGPLKTAPVAAVAARPVDNNMTASLTTQSTAAAGGESHSSGTWREWCICCEGEASTVYRVLDCDSMKPLLQLRVTYTCTVYGFPPSPSPSTTVTNTFAAARSSDESAPSFRIKEGKSFLVVEQVTTSTARDWGPSR